jgi:hypothetical protein
MIYSYACDECRILNDVSKPIFMAGETAVCPICNEEMRRIFFPPRVLNRSKPGSFRWDKGKMNAMDDKLAGLRLAESQGPEKVHELTQAFGSTAIYEVIQHKKQNYG